MEDAFFPYPADFLDTIHEQIIPLKGYQSKRPCSGDELIRRGRLGL
jgi:hypothetical protein